MKLADFKIKGIENPNVNTGKMPAKIHIEKDCGDDLCISDTYINIRHLEGVVKNITRAMRNFDEYLMNSIPMREDCKSLMLKVSSGKEELLNKVISGDIEL